MNKAVGIIPARWSSTRFPGKPLHLIAGKALLLRVLERCKRARNLDSVIVATDDMRIADVFTVVTFRELNTHLLQTVGDVRLLRVRSGNAETQIDEHFSDTGHSDTADADKVDMLNSSKHF